MNSCTVFGIREIIAWSKTAPNIPEPVNQSQIRPEQQQYLYAEEMYRLVKGDVQRAQDSHSRLAADREMYYNTNGGCALIYVPRYWLYVQGTG